MAHQATYLRGERRALTMVLSLSIPLAIIVFLCLPGISPIFRLFTNPSGGMLPTLSVGSYMLVSRASYGYSRYSFDGFDLPIAGRWPASLPRRGDIIAFRLPRDHKTFYVKRVVGLPGDKIQMIGGRLSIDGQLVSREPAPKWRDPSDQKAEGESYIERLAEGASYRIIEMAGDTGRYDNTPEFVVPAGHVFALGDNRDNSTDSREQSSRYGIGFVPVELVLGRIVLTFGGMTE